MLDAGTAAHQPPRPTPLLQRRVLDEQMARSRAQDPVAWGIRPWLGPVLVLAGMIAGGQVLLRSIDVASLSTPARIALGIGFTAGPELILLAVCLAFARPIAAREDGWATAFGWGWVRRSDWAAFGLGVAGVYAGRLILAQISRVVTDGRASQQAQNLTLTHRPTVLGAAVLVVTVAVIAPVAEELMFRGLLLRTVMRRTGFWPAAALSSVTFALFHVYEVTTLLGATFLVASLLVLGGVNCYLVRITGRLAPGMLVHAAFNLLAVVVVLAMAGST